ncbi:uncharacterized protein L969DRAFT_15297 [Mixia osmundae IAM 14324]|uniref:Sugar phosphate transporter domain-containing protein n=1 Tax=Mixia osmundae (strain CBS 9802 / IAM 14324 / JCM 22182 / KY 12970) TaxID=764103 RepID=G7DXB5_MIXOS|nr:uncharacterized protein L969DRAFT_15297 [Mixia osmundae IAM 14324]KEI41281.1 hypothetical protein L969DRAFT_15297 [Mixia osmundae IAM 14324]GAA95225.1 hypothetical protein E5Q_01881 [Mixia osmundae IAM 14324]
MATDLKANGLSNGDSKYPMEDVDTSAKDKLLAEAGAALPPPGHARRESTSDQVKKLHPGVVIAIWISLSSSVILYNKAILDKQRLNFPYPIFLTTFHLTFATIGTRILLKTTHLLDGLANVNMTWDRWIKSILPIGALFSASLIFSNMAYLTLSVSFIQMLKAFTAVAVLGMSILMGLETFTQRTFFLVLFISSGVALASYGELTFVLSGFIFQTLGVIFEASRLVSIQKLLHGMKMDPLVSLYMFAPVCAGINALIIPFTEGTAPFELAWERLGPFILLSNASVAFLLNISVVFLIGCASSLVLTLSGVLKDILLVTASVLLMGSSVTITQLAGYSIALTGLVLFKTKPEIVDQIMDGAKKLVGR